MAFGAGKAFSGPGAVAFDGTRFGQGIRQPLFGSVSTAMSGAANGLVNNLNTSFANVPQPTRGRVGVDGSGWAPGAQDPNDPGPRIGVTDSNGNPGVSSYAGAATPYRYPDSETVQGYVAPKKGDYDISQPEAGELAWSANGQRFFDQGPALQWWNEHQHDLDSPTANERIWETFQRSGPLANNSQREYDNFKRPVIASEPGFGSYYDNAERNTVNQLGRQLAMMGAYGSSVGLGQIGKSISDLRGDQALHEADYNLKRLGEQREWDTLGGSLARNADLTGQGNLGIASDVANNATNSALERTRTGADIATAVDKGDVTRLSAGMTGALGAQGARDARIDMGHDALEGATGSLQSIIGDNWDKVLSGDMQLLDAIQAAYLGKTRENANWASSQEGRMTSDLIGLLTAIQGGSTGGGETPAKTAVKAGARAIGAG